MSLLGDSGYNELKLIYDDIEFYHNNGAIESLVSFDPSLFEIDGITLNKNRLELISMFGEPEYESEANGYNMSFYTSYGSIYFELGTPDSEAWRITISPNI